MPGLRSAGRSGVFSPGYKEAMPMKQKESRLDRSAASLSSRRRKQAGLLVEALICISVCSHLETLGSRCKENINKEVRK